MGFSSDHYLHDSATLAQNTFSSLEAHLSSQTRRNWLEARGTLDAWALMQSRAAFGFESSEAYLGVQGGEGSTALHLRVGRKLESWSPLDEVWEMGIWQPRFRWDYFEPKPVGLTGFFGSVETPGFSFLAFASPLSVPERGVPLQAEAGQLSSPLRWFTPPPARLTLGGTSLPIRYDLAMPPMADLLINPSAGLLVHIGKTEGAWGSAAYSFQPIAQPRLGYDGYLSLAPDRGGEFVATVVPGVEYHHLLSVSGGWNTPRWSAWLSALAENPVLSGSQDPTLTYQAFTPARTGCATWQYRAERSALTVSYLLQTGGNAPDEGPLADGATSLFESRYPYHQALLAQGRTELSARTDITARVIYDLGHNGAIWSPQLNFRPYPALALNLGADLLSAGFGHDEGGSDFIARNRINSRLRSGVSYVF